MPSSAPPVTVIAGAGTPSAASRARAGVDQLGQHAGVAVADRRAAVGGERGQVRPSGGQQPGVGLAGGQVEDAGRGTGSRRGPARRPPAAGAGPGCRCRPAVSTRPRWRSSWYAAATVAGLTPSSAASARTGGSAAPAASAPPRTPASTLAEISAAVRPLI